MEEILYLEPDEEITSVIDKLRQSKAVNIALVVPRGATLLQSVINLKLLLREAENLNKKIAIITSDKIGRNLAAQVGLIAYDSLKNQEPIFQPPPPEMKNEDIIEIKPPEVEEKLPSARGVSVHHFQQNGEIFEHPKTEIPKAKVAVSKKKNPINWKRTYKIVLPILGLFVLMSIVALIVTWPKVQVVIKLQAENFENTSDIKISGDSAAPADQLKGNLIELNLEKEEEFPTTGKKNLGGKSSGTLTVYNYWDSSPQSFPKGTKFSSSSKTFISKASVAVAGTSIKGGNIVPGTASVDIEAEQPGDDYNVKAGRFTIVGLNASQQEKIYGQSSQDLSGGFTKEVKIVSQDDYDKAKEKIEGDLKTQLGDNLKEQAVGMEIIEKAIQFEEQNVQSSVQVSAEAEQFSLKIKERLRIIVYRKIDFENFVIANAEKQIPYDKMISFGKDDKITPEFIDYSYDQKVLNLKAIISAKLTSRLDIAKIKNDLRGKNNSQAETYLQGLGGVEGFDIIYSPKWYIKRIPSYKRSLNVEINYLPEEQNENTGT